MFIFLTHNTDYLFCVKVNILHDVDQGGASSLFFLPAQESDNLHCFTQSHNLYTYAKEDSEYFTLRMPPCR